LNLKSRPFSMIQISRKKDFAITQAREKLVSLFDIAYYHIVSRCVPRTFLFGFDAHSGVS
jgi:hypothetical protein